jgi:hypothetical protein
LIKQEPASRKQGILQGWCKAVENLDGVTEQQLFQLKAAYLALTSECHDGGHSGSVTSWQIAAAGQSSGAR